MKYDTVFCLKYIEQYNSIHLFVFFYRKIPYYPIWFHKTLEKLGIRANRLLFQIYLFRIIYDTFEKSKMTKLKRKFYEIINDIRRK